MKKTIEFYLGILFFSLIISIPLLIPYIHSGYFPTHDGEWAVVRLADMFREIRDLQIPPRFSGNLNFGYGYPLFNFAYPFPYYLALIVHLVGFGFVSSIKIIFSVSVIFSAFFMFLASRNIWKNDYAGIISSVLYLYFPYRMVDLFVRGSIGESVAFALMPMILFCFSKLVDNPKSRKFIIAGGILFACLILTHNIMSVLFSITLIIFFIGFYINEKNKIIKPFSLIILFGFMLSAFFWIPALYEKKYILLSKVPIADRNLYFVNIKELLFSKWGYGVPTDKENGFSYQIGWSFIAMLITSIFTLLFIYYKKIIKNKDLVLPSVLVIGVVIYSLLMFSFSKPIWKLPLLSEINYPWIILSQIGFIISILAGFLTNFKITKYIAFTIAIISILLYLPYAKPEKFINREDSFYITNDATTTSSSELMPLWVKTFPFERNQKKVEIIKGNGEIVNLIQNSKTINFKTRLIEDSVIRINTIYYPGWQIYINGKKTIINYSNNKGVIDIKVLKGDNLVLGVFSETKLRFIADLVSISGIILILIFAFNYSLFRRIKK